MNKSYYDADYPQTNRDKAMRPIRDKCWCEHCDRNIVAVGARCSICHYINGWPRKRLKR